MNKNYRKQQKDRQEILDKEKWEESQTQGRDMSGEMEYCNYCSEHIFGTFCRHNQKERETKFLCARAWNNMQKKSK